MLSRQRNIEEAYLGRAAATALLARIDAPDADWEAAASHLSTLARDAVAMAADLPGEGVAARAGALAKLLCGRYRYTGAALTSDLAWLIGAGFAPLVALGLCANFGLSWLGAYLLSGALGTLIALGINRAKNYKS